MLLNTLSVDASNACLQVKHPSRHTTSLFIHVADCVGHLFPDTSYTLVIPQGLLETRDGMESPRIVHVFSTDSVWYACARFQAVAEGAFRCGSTRRWCSARLPVRE